MKAFHENFSRCGCLSKIGITNLNENGGTMMISRFGRWPVSITRLNQTTLSWWEMILKKRILKSSTQPNQEM